MISEKEFDRDAAMLAGMVGGHLKHVDSITSDRSQAANRIDINNFLAPLKGGPAPVANPFDPANRGYVPEALVQSMAPDVSINIIENSPVITGPPSGSGTFTPLPFVTTRDPVIPVANVNTAELLEDIKSIKATLLKIDGTFSKIAGMMGKVFNFIMDKEKTNNSK